MNQLVYFNFYAEDATMTDAIILSDHYDFKIVKRHESIVSK